MALPENKPKILIVDNDAAARELRMQLMALGYESFSQAASGEAAIAIAKQLRPDVVLIDTDVIGRVNGLAIAQTILSQYSLPVIFLSTFISNPNSALASASVTAPAATDRETVTALRPAEALEATEIVPSYRTIQKPFSLREIDALIELAVYKHQVEAKLKRSQERLRLSRLGSLDGVWDWDLVKNDMYCSPRWYEILGYEADELSPTPKKWQEITHPDDLPDAAIFIANTMKSNALSYEREVRLRHKDGRYVPLLVRAVIVRDSARWATRVGGTITDLTVRKRMEAELDAHRHFAAQIINTMGQGVSVTDTDGRLEFANPALARLFNCKVTDLIGKRAEELFVPEDMAVIAEHRAARWAGKTSTYELRVRRADGSISPVEITGAPRMQHGKFTGSIAVVVDLTHRKQAELALRNSADFSAAIAESMPDKLGYWDTGLRCRFANKHYAEWFGLSVCEMQNITMQELLGERFQYNEPYARAALGGETRSAEFRVHRNGAEFDFLAQYMPHWVNGEVVGLFLIVTDITALKLGQEKLRVVGVALESVAQGVVISTPDLRIFSVNDAFTSITGYSKDEAEGQTCEFLRGPLTDPDTVKSLEDAAASGMEFSCELLNYRKNGRPFWLELTSSPVRDEHMHVTHHVAVMRDITRRRSRDIERESESKVLELVAAGGSLPYLLTELVVSYESQFEGMRGSILLLDAGGQHLRHCAAPSLPQAYCEEIDGMEIGLGVGSCGTSAATGKTVIASDIAQNDLWRDFMELALAHELRACWSVPILGTAGKVLGTFAFYFSEPRDALASELLMIERGAQLASLAIERHLANTALSDSERRYRALVEWSPEPIVVHRNGRFIYVNPAFATLLGATSPQQLIGNSLIDFVHPASKLMVGQRMQTMAKGEAVAPMIEFKGMRFDGTMLDVETQGTAIVFDGEPAVHVVVRDVTARKQAEAARGMLESQLRESQKMEAIGTLAGGIAHDFNNILVTILGNADLASNDATNNPQTIESLTEIRKAGTRARDLVQQILSFSRRQPTERKRVDIRPVVEESVRLLRATLPVGLSLELRCQPLLPLVLADTTQIQQVVINLATNAMHAIQASRRKVGCIDIQLDTVIPNAALGHGHPALATLFALHPGRTVRLSVTDNGRGMDAATVNRIFEPFFTTKPVDEGTGLGLSVVHGIAKSHEGAIVVESMPDRGSTFTLYLPVVEVPAAIEDPVAPEPVAAPTGSASSTPKSTSTPKVGPHILYVDDDESLVFLLKRLLERRGLRISAYLDQAEALEALRADPEGFDLVVSDYNMPGMSGLEVAREARSIRADMPVAIASGFIDETLRAGAEGAGVQELIFKASAVEDLCDAFVRLAHSAMQNKRIGKVG